MVYIWCIDYKLLLFIIYKPTNLQLQIIFSRNKVISMVYYITA